MQPYCSCQMGPADSGESVGSVAMGAYRTMGSSVLSWEQPLTTEAILAPSSIADFVSEHVNVSFPVIKSVLVEFWQ